MKVPKAMVAVGILLVAGLSLALTLPAGLPGLLDLTADRLEPAPEIHLASPADGDGVGPRVRIAGQALSSAREVLDVQFRVDGGRWTSAPLATRGQRSTSFEVEIDLPEGDHLIETRATDGRSLSLIARATVRHGAPTVAILQPASGDGVATGSTLVSGTVVGAAELVVVSINGEEYDAPVAGGLWRVAVPLGPGIQEIRATAHGVIRSLTRSAFVSVGSPAPPSLSILTPRAHASYGAAGDLTCGGGCILASGMFARASQVTALLDGAPVGPPDLVLGTWSVRIPMVSLANGTHELTLVATDTFEQRSVAQSVRFLAHTSIALSITGSDVPAPTGTSLSFEALGTDAQSANWSLDGEALAQGGAVAFTLTTPGDHILSVQTTAPRGRSASASIPLHAINRPPTLSFLGDPIYREGAYQFAVTASDPDGSVVAFHWDLGDGTLAETTVPSIIHRYFQRGDLRITVGALDDQGGATTVSTSLIVSNVAPFANFSWTPAEPTVLDVISLVDTSRDHDGSLVERFWRFPDGNASDNATPTLRLRERGPHNVSLRVVDELGLATDITRAIMVHDIPPTPAFRFEPALPLTHQEVLFGDLSTDPDGPLSSWDWDFGDGGVGTGSAAIHIYRAPGNYTVRLNVTDDFGLSANLSRNITIGDSLPIVRAVTIEPPEPIAQQEARFTVVAEDRDGAIVAAHWQFGDGTNSTQSDARHRYPRSGPYSGNVTVYDEGGLTITFPFFLLVHNAPPSVALEVKPNGRIAGFPTILHANASDPDGRITFYRFDADGDGNVDCETPEPFCAHVYETSGTFSASAWVEDDEGETGHTQMIIDVNLPPADHPPPTVRVESPARGVTLRGDNLFRGIATGPREIRSVDFQLRTPQWAYSGGREPWRSVTGTREWQQLIDTRAFADGDYDLVARAIDIEGGVGYQRVPVHVQNGPRPSDVTVQLVAPPATIDEDVLIRASAFHPSGITSVRWRLDLDTWTTETENPLAFTIEIDRDALKPGEHVLRVEAYHGVTDSANVTHVFTVPGVRPTLVVDEPPNPLAYGLLRAAGRIVGQGHAQWRIDQDVWRDIPPGPGWDLTHETSNYRGGRHTLTLRAISPDGRLTSDPITYRIEIVNPPFSMTESGPPGATPSPERGVPAAGLLGILVAGAVALGIARRR